jgi:hypothetical protein
MIRRLTAHIEIQRIRSSPISGGGTMAQFVSEFGEMWARNTQNIEEIRGSKHGGQGVYILYDGSMPVYVGKGNIRSRIRKARKSKRRGELWDHFSWYVIPDIKMRHDVEALLLRMLPRYLLSLNQQNGHLLKAKQVSEADRDADYISRKMLRRRKLRP